MASTPSRPGEFEIIARYFRPLAWREEAEDLRNDAGRLAKEDGKDLVVTSDILLSAVHFFAEDAPQDIARKALRVNLSDLASMGASPWGYSLCLGLPEQVDEAWIAAFAEGLRLDQERFGCSLIGGDTTRSPQGVVVSITAYGLVPSGKGLSRKNAQPGDLLFLSGPLGYAALGLQLRQGEGADLSAALRERALAAYLLPEPACDLARFLPGRATACLDVSDGLLADLGHLCEESGLSAVVNLPALLSEELAELTQQDPALAELFLTGGDDYQLLFSLPPEAVAEFQGALSDAGFAPERMPRLIGRLAAGEASGSGKVRVVDGQGEKMLFSKVGWRHF